MERGIKQVILDSDILHIIFLNNSQHLSEIEPSVSTVNAVAQFYTDLQCCIDIVKDTIEWQVLVVVSNSLARDLLESIHDSNIVIGFLIYDPEHQSLGLNEQYSKVIEIISDREILLQYLRSGSRHFHRASFDFTLFNQKQKSTRDLTKESASFLWYQMLIYVLKQIPTDDRTMNDMLTLCTTYYEDDKQELANIEKFRQTYTHDKAINWYIEECFLYKLLNQALRTEDVHLLYSFRLFIVDLCSELERENQEMKEEASLIVYRGQMMANEELKKLEQNIGQLISTNGFFSTSRDIKIALGFLKKSNDTIKRVLFEIKIDPSQSDIIYADISRYGSMPWEQEVLFSLNAVFQIVSVNIDKANDVWRVELIANNQGQQKVNEYVKWLELEIDSTSPLVYFGRLLWSELGQLTMAEHHFKMLLDTLPNNHSDIPSIYQEFSHVYDEKCVYDLALQYAQRSLQLRQEQKPVVPVCLASSLNTMGIIYQHKGDLDRAIDYYQQSLNVYENQMLNGKHLHQSNTLTNLGTIHKDRANYDLAFECFAQAYNMRRELLPADHPRIASSLSNLGSIYHDREDYDKAFEYYEQALTIQQKICPDDHLTTANTLRNIALVYRDKQDWNNALTYFERTLNMRRHLLGDAANRDIAVCYGDIGQVYEKLTNWNQALDYYRQQVTMEEQCLPMDHPHLALHFDWIISMMKKRGDVDEARKLCEEKQTMLMRLLGHNYASSPRYAHTLVSLATVLEDDDIQKALEYYEQAFKVLKEHPNLDAYRICLSAMVNFFWKNKMYDQALIYQPRLVDHQRSTLSPKNKELAVSLRGLARIYQTVKDYEKASLYFNESLAIFQVVYGPNNQEVKDILTELEQLKEIDVTASDSTKKENSDVVVPHLKDSPKQPMPDRKFTSHSQVRQARSAACFIL